MFTLSNPLCRATISPHGAELVSLVAPKSGLEYLWQADPAVWGRHAPVLFPIVGRLPQDVYVHQGQSYKLSQHGFARDQEFTVLHQSSTEVALQLVDSPAMRAMYPFAFELLITYTLLDCILTVRWDVRNPSADQELPFSIGAHPAFRCPLLPHEQFEDYFFAFDQPVTLERHLLQGGLLNGETEPLLQEQDKLPLTYELFAQDALVITDFDFNALTLRSQKSTRFVRLQFDGFPYLGLWTKGPGAPFVCIEPWHGIASSVDASPELRDKAGIITLPPGGAFTAAYTVEIG